VTLSQQLQGHYKIYTKTLHSSYYQFTTSQQEQCQISVSQMTDRKGKT